MQASVRCALAAMADALSDGLAELTPEERAELPDFTPNIYKVVRALRKDDHGPYNCLASIVHDTHFVKRVVFEYSLPAFANLRCGLWYAGKGHGLRTEDGADLVSSVADTQRDVNDLRCPINGTCYFKSTDGHCNNWSFSATRLNMHVAECAARAGGCLIIDATRSTTKRFPDSLSKTIPIWAAVVNRCIYSMSDGDTESNDKNTIDSAWRCGPFLPPWVSDTERESIKKLMSTFEQRLETVNPDLNRLKQSLLAPLRCVWVSRDTLDKGMLPFLLPDLSPSERMKALGFTPVILVSASSTMQWHGERRVTLDGDSFAYVPGAGDDEESWANRLTADAFWRRRLEIMKSPGECQRLLDAVVQEESAGGHGDKEGLSTLSVLSRVSTHTESETAAHTNDKVPVWQVAGSSDARRAADGCLSLEARAAAAASTGVPLGAVQYGATRTLGGDSQLKGLALGSVKSLSLNETWESHRAVLYVGDHRAAFPESFFDTASDDTKEISFPAPFLHVPMRSVKVARNDVADGLKVALQFIDDHSLDNSSENDLLIVCNDGADHCVGVVVAFLTRVTGSKLVTKDCVRRNLAVVSAQNPEASPSRGTLKQVFNFLLQVQREARG